MQTPGLHLAIGCRDAGRNLLRRQAQCGGLLCVNADQHFLFGQAEVVHRAGARNGAQSVAQCLGVARKQGERSGVFGRGNRDHTGIGRDPFGIEIRGQNPGREIAAGIFDSITRLGPDLFDLIVFERFKQLDGDNRNARTGHG